MNAKIVVVGSLNMDLVARSPRIPQPGETILGGELQYHPGGKGANQAVAAARLGGQVTMIGRVGRDAFAQPLLDNLAASDVDHTYVLPTPDVATGVALIVVDDNGQNSIVVTSGANNLLTPLDVDAAESVIEDAQVLLLQLETPIETVHRAAEVAHRHGVTVILNPAPAQKLPDELLRLVDILIPNESETALLTGMPAVKPEDTIAAGQALRVLGIETVIITLGKAGAVLIQEGEPVVVPTFHVNAVDTTAAGDAFVGSLAVALAERLSLREAVRRGNAAGALSTTKPGAQPSLPTRAEVEALIGGG